MQQFISCPNCGASNALGQKYCGVCGAALSTGCYNCGAEIDPGSRFCGNCGATLPVETPQQSAWEQPTGGMQQGAWGQPQQPMQQPQGAWGQPQQPMQQQQGAWGQPPRTWGEPPGGSGTSSSSTTILIVALIVLLAGLGVFGYFAFFSDSPPWSGLTSSGGLTVEVTKGPFVTGTADNTTGKADMTITWETDKVVKGMVEYGTSESYGSQSDWEDDYVKSHSISLDNLNAETSYYYKITLVDKKGNEVEKKGTPFKTPQ